MSEEQNELLTGLKIWANVGVDLGKQVEAATKTNRALWNRLQGMTPVDYQTYASGAYPSTGFLTLNLGSPDQGTYWEIKSVAIGGNDENVTVAGNAGLYVSGMPGATGMNMIRDVAETLPNIAFYGTRALIVKEQDTLYLNIYNGTSGQNYVANACMTVFNVAAGLGSVEISA